MESAQLCSRSIGGGATDGQLVGRLPSKPVPSTPVYNTSVHNHTGKNLMNTCFMCDKPATTKDHIPPLCFFPEQKDIPKGANYRKNLITVPACDEHNSKTSMDDEYLLGA